MHGLANVKLRVKLLRTLKTLITPVNNTTVTDKRFNSKVNCHRGTSYLEVKTLQLIRGLKNVLRTGFHV